MANVSCMVKRAEPFAGDDLSEMQAQYWAVNQILEPFFDVSEHDDDPTPEIVITNLEVKYISGSYEYWYSLNNPAVENIAFENRPTTEFPRSLMIGCYTGIGSCTKVRCDCIRNN